MTELLGAFAKAKDAAERRPIAAKIQEAAYQSVPSVMWGQFAIPVGYRTRVRDLIQSAFPMLWNVEIAA